MGVELLKMMKHGNSWYSNWVKEGFMYSILSYIRADIRLHQCIECLSAHIILYCYFLLNVSIYIDELYVPLALPPDRSTSAVCFLNCDVFPPCPVQQSTTSWRRRRTRSQIFSTSLRSPPRTLPS